MEIFSPPKKTPATSIEDICPLYPFFNRSIELQEHIEQMKGVLSFLLNGSLPFHDNNSFSNWVKETLPIIKYSDNTSIPGSISIALLCKPLKLIRNESYFLKMVKLWLIPYEETTILSFLQMPFYFNGFIEEPLFMAKAQVLVKNKREEGLIRDNIPLFIKSMKNGIRSGDYAKKILETKVFSLSNKMECIQETLVKILNRFPAKFNKSIFSGMAYTCTHTTSEFQEQRSYSHLTRMIISLFVIRNQLDKEARTFPEKRHMKIKFLRTELEFPFGKKPVVGLVIVVNLFHKYESFEEKHILLSLQQYISTVQIVPGSFYRFYANQGPVLTLYVEVEKKDGSRFSLVELGIFKQNLVQELIKRIEYLVPSLFKVRNEEETMRNILLLSQELKSSVDLPQIMVSFDQHSQDDLTFTVILLRVKNEKTIPIQNLLQDVDQRIHFIPDRIQVVTYLKKKHPIEANVFRLQIAKLPIFLRMDFSVNLYLARQEVLTFLHQNIGEVRDYNGGMIIKQGELLSQIKRLFSDLSNKNQELLENFFYSLNPIESQATIPLQALSLFFEVFIRQVEKKISKDESYHIEFQNDNENTFAIIKVADLNLKKFIESQLTRIQIYDYSLISSFLSFEGIHYMSFYYCNEIADKQKQFKQALIGALAEWEKERKKLQTLRFNITDFRSSDPRIGGDQESSIIIKMLFNGLMRLSEEGKVEPSIADTYEISADKMQYIFRLKDTYWSNGSKLVAYDFEYAWKKILSPDFSTPFAFFFYPIKQAKMAKDGHVSIDQVGIKAIDDQTLVVELENPTPYFLELTASTLYSPVNHNIDRLHPNWATEKNDNFVCNGAFKIKKNNPFYLFEFENNPYYWNKLEVKIDQIVIYKADSQTAFDMYKNDELDFLASPLIALKNHELKQIADNIIYYPTNKVFWFVYNVEHFPFSNLKMRRAFSYAVNREKMRAYFPVDNELAFTPLSLNLTQHKNADYLIREDEEKAKVLFEEALLEMELSRHEFPIISIVCVQEEFNIKISEILKYDWERIFGITCKIEIYNWIDLFEKMTLGDFQVGAMHWVSLVNDPIYTLSAFRYKNEKVNFAKWENIEYQDLLNAADKEINLNKRKAYLSKAEKLLIQESLVLPIFHHKYWLVKKESLHLPCFAALSYMEMDFSRAFYKK